MLARVIENWLASTIERGGYEIPFCQALAAKGQSIVFRSTHGQLEQGKDIITIDRHGQYHAYQLKTGDLSLPAYNKIQAEVDQLVRLPLLHPNVTPTTPFRPYLVTNGRLKDPTRAHLVQWNIEWAQVGRGPLTVLDQDYLLPLFLETHGEVLPVTPADFARFLGLFLADKRDLLEKADLAGMLEAFIPYEKEAKRAELRRVFSGTAVLANYILSGYHGVGNHVACIDGWMVVIAHQLRLAEKVSGYRPVWQPSIELSVTAWEESLNRLVDEALQRSDWMEGDAFADHELIYRWRVTVVLGYLAAAALHSRAKGQRHPREGEILTTVLRRLNAREVYFWGEEAGATFFIMALLLWLHGQEAVACSIARNLAREIVERNGARSGRGVPDPYFTGRDILAVTFDAADDDLFKPQQTFRGQSYVLRVFVEFLARRGWKRMLQQLWYGITKVDSVEYRPRTSTDLYRWRSKHGSIDVRHWDEPQEWCRLVERAAGHEAPNLLLTDGYRHLLVGFLLTYPHRLTPSLAAHVETSVAA